MPGRVCRLLSLLLLVVLSFARCKSYEAQNLVPRLKNIDSREFNEARSALDQLGESAVEPLIAALEDRDPDVRQGAAFVLGDFNDQRDVEPLIACLQDPDVRADAEKALSRMHVDKKLLADTFLSRGDLDHAIRYYRFAKDQADLEKAYSARYDVADPVFKAVKTARITIDQTYEGRRGSLLTTDMVKRILAYFGIEVVDPRSSHYDMAIEIWIQGAALSGEYGANGVLYTGSSVQGSVEIRVVSLDKIIEFSDENNPPHAFPTTQKRISELKHIENAPYGQSLFPAFQQKMFEIFMGYYGRTFLLSALDDSDHLVRIAAARILGETRDPRAVVPLIAMVEHCLDIPDVESAAIEALGRSGDRGIREASSRFRKSSGRMGSSSLTWKGH